MTRAKAARIRIEWAMLGMALLILGGAVGYMVYADYREIEAVQGDRLQVQARVIDENLGRQIEGVNNALAGIRDDLQHWNGKTMSVSSSHRLKVLSEAMPGVRTLNILNAEGTVLDSNRDELIGKNFSEREYFTTSRAGADPSKLYVSAPFKTTLGAFSLNLSLVLTDSKREFAGIVSATLDPDYFNVLLNSVLYAPDMRALLAHRDGKAFVFMPPREGVVGMDLAKPGSFFSRHRESGKSATLLLGTAAASGDERMMASRNVVRAGLPMDKPLIVHVSRNVSDIYASWRAQSFAYGMLYALFAAMTGLILLFVQRRQRTSDQIANLQEKERRESAERLELALAGADLGLWDWHVPSGRMTLNERWYAMLGFRKDEVEPDIGSWEKLVHPEEAQFVQKQLERHFKGETSGYETEHRLRHKDGRWIWILDRGKVVERDATGVPVRMVGTYMDITERKRVQDEREQYFRFFELSLDPMCIADPFGCFKQVNPAFMRLSGYGESELLSKPFLEFILPEDRQRTADEMKLQVAVRPTMHFDNRYVSKDGQAIYLNWTAYFDKSDGVTYATARDFTAQKRKEDEYQTVIQASVDGFWITDFSGRILEVNGAICHMLGYGRHELLRMRVADIEVQESPEEIEAGMRRMMPDGSAKIQGRHRRKDGSIIDVDVSVLCVAALGERFFVFLRDVTERKRTELSLFEARKLLDEVERLSKLGGWKYDCATGVMTWTDEVYRIYGVGKDYDPSNIESRDNFYLPEDAKLTLGAFWRAVKTGEPYDVEVQLLRSNGERIWIRTIGTPLVDNGRVVSVTGSVIDITERKAAEEALRKSVAFRELLSEATPLPVFHKDASGRYTGCNSAFARFFGKSRDEIVGKTVSELWPDGSARIYADRDLELLGDPGGTQTYESRVGHVDGTLHDVIFHKARITDDTGNPTGIVGVITDITELKQEQARRAQLEAQLRESQKMQALGTLAGGVAHDFNNIIAAVLGNVELARQDVGPGHAALESLDEIRKASRRAKELVQQILAFGRRQVASRAVISLAPVVEESARLLRTTLPAGVTLNVESEPDAPTVLADATQVEQVLLNLCANSWHAIENQGRPGTITIRLQAHDRPAGGARHAGFAIASGDLPPGLYARLSVRDNGSGMDRETLARMFEPFFTTKPVGKGTGLGLAVVHGIVKEHGGYIEVGSMPGEGSTFNVYFPATTSVEADQARAPEAASVHGQGKRVLYVDDDEAIVFLMTRLLERQGYIVSGFTDAREALAAARADPDQFDLAVTDFNMPGISGLDLACELRAIRADLPVAVASGYITDELRKNAPAAGVSELIYKPNTVEELCEAVARLASKLPA